MNSKKDQKKILLFFFIFFYLSYFLFLYQIFKKNQKFGDTAGIKTSQIQNVEVYAFIGEHRFSLYGYTSPFALVTFSGLGIFDQTIADKDGYFIFKNRFSPFSPREACLVAQDQLGRLTSPLCLPPFPTDYNVEIGPVIMPPTLSLDKNEYWVGDEVILSGQGIPNSTVNLSFFSQENYQLIPNFLVKIFLLNPVYAQNPNTLETNTDNQGNFSINLSASQAKKLRLFTQINFDQKISPESRKLTVEILPWWGIFFKFFSLVFLIFKSRLLEFIILLEIIVLIAYFLRRYFHPQHLAIIRRENLAIIKKS